MAELLTRTVEGTVVFIARSDGWQIKWENRKKIKCAWVYIFKCKYSENNESNINIRYAIFASLFGWISCSVSLKLGLYLVRVQVFIILETIYLYILHLSPQIFSPEKILTFPTDFPAKLSRENSKYERVHFIFRPYNTSWAHSDWSPELHMLTLILWLPDKNFQKNVPFLELPSYLKVAATLALKASYRAQTIFKKLVLMNFSNFLQPPFACDNPQHATTLTLCEYTRHTMIS